MFSFYPSKNLGAPGRRDADNQRSRHAQRLHMLRLHGEEEKIHHKIVGITAGGCSSGCGVAVKLSAS